MCATIWWFPSPQKRMKIRSMSSTQFNHRTSSTVEYLVHPRSFTWDHLRFGSPWNFKGPVSSGKKDLVSVHIGRSQLGGNEHLPWLVDGWAPSKKWACHWLNLIESCCKFWDPHGSATSNHVNGERNHRKYTIKKMKLNLHSCIVSRDCCFLVNIMLSNSRGTSLDIAGRPDPLVGAIQLQQFCMSSLLQDSSSAEDRCIWDPKCLGSHVHNI